MWMRLHCGSPLYRSVLMDVDLLACCIHYPGGDELLQAFGKHWCQGGWSEVCVQLCWWAYLGERNYVSCLPYVRYPVVSEAAIEDIAQIGLAKIPVQSCITQLGTESGPTALLVCTFMSSHSTSLTLMVNMLGTAQSLFSGMKASSGVNGLKSAVTDWNVSQILSASSCVLPSHTVLAKACRLLLPCL